MRKARSRAVSTRGEDHRNLIGTGRGNGPGKTRWSRSTLQRSRRSQAREEAGKLRRVSILGPMLTAAVACGTPALSMGAPDCAEYASAVTQFENAAQAAHRELDLNRVERKVTSGGQWAVAQSGYFESRVALMSHKRDPSAMLRAYERVAFAVEGFNTLSRLDTEEAVFAMRRIGDAMAAFHREVYALACEEPVLEECAAYGVAVEHLAELAAALPEMTSDPGEIRSAQGAAFELADRRLKQLTFPNWRHTLRNTELAFAEHQMEAARTHAGEQRADANAQHRVSEAVLAVHHVIYASFCAPGNKR